MQRDFHDGLGVVRVVARALLGPAVLSDGRGVRDPVAKAEPSPSARAKKRTKTTDDGWPVQSLRTLLSELGTRCKNTCRAGEGKNVLRFEQLTETSPIQQHVFTLLGLTPRRTVTSNPAN